MTSPLPKDSEVYRTLIESLSDGVMVVGLEGTVQVANSAFCRMFGLDPGQVAGAAFGELFLEAEDVDEFTQAVLDAVFSPGDTERRVVSVRIDGEPRALAVTTTYLASGQGGEGERGPVAAVAAVSDITEIRELRDAELRLAKTVESQFADLQKAYRDLETRSEALSSMTRRVRVGRVAAVVLVLGLFAGIGAWRFQQLDLLGYIARDLGPSPATGAPDTAGPLTLAVEAREIRSTIKLRGNLGLGRTEEVVSPFEGNVSELHASPGQAVARGDPLLTLDTGKLAAEIRRAEVDHIRARDKLAELEDWANSGEMARARNTLRRSRITVQEAEEALVRSSFLYERGIISRQEHEQAKRSRTERGLDHEAAERDFAAVEGKSSEKTRLVARLEADTALAQLQSLKERRELSTVNAPISGIFIAAEGPDSQPLAKGRPVTQGERLATVADFEQLAVVTTVDEVDVQKVAVGQRALVTGPGFPDLEINGTVERVASRSIGRGLSRGGPQFEVVIALDRLDSGSRAQLLVGMSAYLEIIVHSRPDALMVPIRAVQQDGGAAYVNVVSQDTGAVERRPVVTGLTTLDSIEVVEGLVAGESVALLP